MIEIRKDVMNAMHDESRVYDFMEMFSRIMLKTSGYLIFKTEQGLGMRIIIDSIHNTLHVIVILQRSVAI